MRGGSYGLLTPGLGGGGVTGGGGQLSLAGGWLLRASRVIPAVLFILVIASLCAHYYLSKVSLGHLRDGEQWVRKVIFLPCNWLKG